MPVRVRLAPSINAAVWSSVGAGCRYPVRARPRNAREWSPSRRFLRSLTIYREAHPTCRCIMQHHHPDDQAVSTGSRRFTVTDLAGTIDTGIQDGHFWAVDPTPLYPRLTTSSRRLTSSHLFPTGCGPQRIRHPPRGSHRTNCSISVRLSERILQLSSSVRTILRRIAGRQYILQAVPPARPQA